MKLERAIEILTIVAVKGGVTAHDDFINATKLGIEALNRLEWLREQLQLMATVELPGETKD